ncbi:MAG: EamA family transporter [Pseudonocardiales bacterium]|nr:EamA family transporter [Pseudonocardiales bacterium]
MALLSFVGSAVFAGANAVGIRFSNRELAPLWGAGLRFGIAAALLVAAMVAMRLELPRGRDLGGAVLYGLLNFAGAFALAYYALLEMQAGIGQTLLALVPLATLLVAVLVRQEQLRVMALVGTLLALAGVALVARAPLGAGLPPLSLIAALGSVVCFAVAAVVVRRFRGVHPVTMNAVGMSSGAAVLIAASLLAGERQALPRLAATWLALGYLVVLGSVLVFLLYLRVVQQWSASRAAYIFVLAPFVTVLLSAWLDSEAVGWGLVLGGALVLLGVYVGALRPAAHSRTVA